MGEDSAEEGEVRDVEPAYQENAGGVRHTGFQFPLLHIPVCVDAAL